MPPADLGVVFRPMVAEDEGFVLSSWLRSYRDRFARAIAARPHELDYRRYWSEDGLKGAVVAQIRRTGGVVCADSEDPETILGWAVGNVECVHYVYVKASCRRRGLGSRLLREIAGGETCSFLTAAGQQLNPSARCNPLMIFA